MHAMLCLSTCYGYCVREYRCHGRVSARKQKTNARIAKKQPHIHENTGWNCNKICIFVWKLVCWMGKKGFANERNERKNTVHPPNKVNTIHECVYVLRAISEVSFFCVRKLLSWNSILWFGMMFYLTSMMISTVGIDSCSAIGPTGYSLDRRQPSAIDRQREATTIRCHLNEWKSRSSMCRLKPLNYHYQNSLLRICFIHSDDIRSSIFMRVHHSNENPLSMLYIYSMRSISRSLCPSAAWVFASI